MTNVPPIVIDPPHSPGLCLPPGALRQPETPYRAPPPPPVGQDHTGFAVWWQREAGVSTPCRDREFDREIDARDYMSRAAGPGTFILVRGRRHKFPTDPELILDTVRRG